MKNKDTEKKSDGKSHVYKPLDIRGYMEYVLQVPRGYPSDKAITVGDGLTVMVQATRNVPYHLPQSM